MILSRSSRIRILQLTFALVTSNKARSPQNSARCLYHS